MIETLAHGYSSESTQQELSNEYQYDRVSSVSIGRVNYKLQNYFSIEELSGFIKQFLPSPSVQTGIILYFSMKASFWSRLMHLQKPFVSCMH